MELRILFLIVALLGAPLSAAFGEVSTPEEASPAVSNLFASEFDRNFPAFVDRAKRLVNSSERTGRIAYHQVLDAVYGPLDAATMEAKAAWRARLQAQGLLLTDYQQLRRRVPVVRRPIASETTTGLYNPAKDQIVIRADGTRTELTFETNTLMHESGHALQRNSLRSWTGRLSTPDEKHEAHKHWLSDSFRFALGSFLDQPPAIPGADPDQRHRYNLYQLSQPELEVRLQELNRFFFIGAGRPVLDPVDAAVALRQSGASITFRETAEALAELGFTLERGALPSRGRLNPVQSEEFIGVRDLNVLLERSRAYGPELRKAVLTAILGQAPGHL
jgi:hypothetical protein